MADDHPVFDSEYSDTGIYPWQGSFSGGRFGFLGIGVYGYMA